MDKNKFVTKWIWSYQGKKMLKHEAIIMINELEKPDK
jgi:hypothetical protein